MRLQDSQDAYQSNVRKSEAEHNARVIAEVVGKAAKPAKEKE
jgi:hypothetical protein